MSQKDQGILTERYKVIPRTLIFITRGDEILLIKGAPHKRLWANLYNGIGGHVEKGEDILSAAQKELSEEAGLICNGMRLCGNIMIDAGQDTGISIFVFVGEYQSGNLVESAEGKVEWVKIKKIPEIPAVEDLKFLVPRVLKAAKENSIFFARYYYDDSDRLVTEFKEN